MDPQNRPFPQAAQLPQASPPAVLPRAQLPPLPSLEHLKKQAKHLLAACRVGDETALERLGRWFPEIPESAEQTAPLTLSQAQLALAREHGCGSWTGLRRAALSALVECLAVRDWRTAAAARVALEHAGEDGVLAAVEGLSHSEPRVRRASAEFLTRFPNGRCVPKLTELALRDPVPYVRRVAVTALTHQRREASPAIPAAPHDLAPLLDRMAREDASARVRWKAVTLGLPTPELVRVAREDPSPRVRQRALKTLGGRRDSALARQTLEQALRDGQPDERRAAHDALRRVSPEYRELAARRAREANQARAGAVGSARATG